MTTQAPTIDYGDRRRFSKRRAWTASTRLAAWFFKPRQPSGKDEATFASPFGITLTCLCYSLAGLAFLSALINLWPAVDPAASESVAKGALSGATAAGPVSAAANAAATTHHVLLLWGVYMADFNKSSGLLMLALLMGAIGGYTIALASLVSEILDQRFFARNGWFYALRPLIGAALGLMFYFAFRAGFANSSADASTASNIDPYGVALVACLAGLFSHQALGKLQTVFGGIGPAGDEAQEPTAEAAEEPAAEARVLYSRTWIFH